MPKSKVFVVGLDGATWDLVHKWVEAGELPVLKQLMSEGAYGDLGSVMQPMSAQAWTSFMTGKNIGKHGLVDFLMRRPGSYDLQIVNAKIRDGKTLWRILSERNRQVSVINVPMTYPPEPVRGFLVSGMDAPTLKSDFTWPEEFREELLRAVPGYVIEAGGHNYIYGNRPDPQRFLDEMLQVCQARYDATCYLMEHQPWDFLMTVFRAIDRAQHWFWKHMDPNHPLHKPGDEAFADTILQVHKAVDGWLGELLDGLEEDVYVIVMSDHGFEPLGDRVVYLNTWLRDEGFLHFRAQPDRRSSSVWSNLQHLAVTQLVWPMWKGLKRNLPTGMHRWLRQAFPQAGRKVSSLIMLSDIDWKQTLAYAMEVRANIWINLKGREPHGIVETGQEYETLRDTIIERLYEWRDPIDGERVVQRVYKREELFHGPHLERTPDLLIQFQRPNGYAYNLRQGVLSERRQAIEVLSEAELLQSLRPYAKHALNGLCIIRGPGIMPGARLQNPEIIDLAPTILYLMGEPVPDDMDGRVLTEALHQDYLAANPIRTVPADYQPTDVDLITYDAEEHEVVEDRLRSLGYID